MQKGGKKTYKDGAIGIQEGGGNLWNRSSQSQKKGEKRKKKWGEPNKDATGEPPHSSFPPPSFPGPGFCFSC